MLFKFRVTISESKNQNKVSTEYSSMGESFLDAFLGLWNLLNETMPCNFTIESQDYAGRGNKPFPIPSLQPN